MSDTLLNSFNNLDDFLKKYPFPWLQCLYFHQKKLQMISKSALNALIPSKKEGDWKYNFMDWALAMIDICGSSESCSAVFEHSGIIRKDQCVRVDSWLVFRKRTSCHCRFFFSFLISKELTVPSKKRERERERKTEKGKYNENNKKERVIAIGVDQVHVCAVPLENYSVTFPIHHRQLGVHTTASRDSGAFLIETSEINVSPLTP